MGQKTLSFSLYLSGPRQSCNLVIRVGKAITKPLATGYRHHARVH